MAAKKFLRRVAGRVIEVLGVQVSAGAGNAGDIVALNDTGTIDETMMPPGIGAEVKLIVASENLAAGDFVNVYDNAGTATCRKADATTNGKPAHGFVLAAVTAAANATVYSDGINNQVSGQVAGDVFLQTTAGLAGATVPSADGNIVQRVGTAVSATEIIFERGETIEIVEPA